MLVVGSHDFEIPSHPTQKRICRLSQFTDYHSNQDRTTANRLGATVPDVFEVQKTSSRALEKPPMFCGHPRNPARGKTTAST
ncbi:unnamed protein product [Caenorhabditis auriculariae]|uniref:Uncharacterized protein n=1 Tax=Caenorhabditis auriculariae TaxID=2777116 RepID=A0A8S1GRM9_9PELO|nr:unnamed protein product [Caenorhabditis auriculariae]